MNCKPGQRAIIINSLEVENIGRVVEVVESWNDRVAHEGVFWPPLSKFVDAHMWLVRSEGNPLAYSHLSGGSESKIHIESGPYGDDWLRPLLDVDEPVAEEEVVETPRQVEHA